MHKIASVLNLQWWCRAECIYICKDLSSSSSLSPPSSPHGCSPKFSILLFLQLWRSKTSRGQVRDVVICIALCLWLAVPVPALLCTLVSHYVHQRC